MGRKKKKEPTKRMLGASFFQEQGDLKNKHRALPLLLVAVRGPGEGLEAESNLPRGHWLTRMPILLESEIRLDVHCPSKLCKNRLAENLLNRDFMGFAPCYRNSRVKVVDL